jgi:hypothetical protein
MECVMVYKYLLTVSSFFRNFITSINHLIVYNKNSDQTDGGLSQTDLSFHQTNPVMMLLKKHQNIIL